MIYLPLEREKERKEGLEVNGGGGGLPLIRLRKNYFLSGSSQPLKVAKAGCGGWVESIKGIFTRDR